MPSRFPSAGPNDGRWEEEGEFKKRLPNQIYLGSPMRRGADADFDHIRHDFGR